MSVINKDASTITLHNNFNDSNTGINTVQIINSGSGKQFFKTVKDKSIINEISVENSEVIEDSEMPLNGLRATLEKTDAEIKQKTI